MPAFILKIIFGGLMVFVPHGGNQPTEAVAVLIDGSQRDWNQITHHPQLRVGCDANGFNCNSVIDIKGKDLRTWLVTGANRTPVPGPVSFGGFALDQVVELSKLGITLPPAVLAKDPARVPPIVPARFVMDGGSLATSRVDDCDWFLKTSTGPVLHTMDRMAMEVSLEIPIMSAQTVPYITMRDHSTSKVVDWVRIDPLGPNGADFKAVMNPMGVPVVEVWLTNDPTLMEGRVPHPVPAPFAIQHFRRYHAASGAPPPADPVLPWRDPNCQDSLPGAGPIICTGARP